MAVNNQHAKTGRILREDDTHINIADMLFNSFTQFNELRVANKRAQLNFNSDLPLSERRDIQTTEGNATITKQGSEYRLRATSTTDDKANLKTAQRGNYQSGSVFEPGSGFRTVGTPTGTAYFRMGYGDDDNGMFLVYDVDGYKLRVINAGTVTDIDQADWNIDTLDGTRGKNNPSGGTLDTSNGIVFQSPFVYYGYGSIIFEVEIEDEFGNSTIRPAHSYNENGGTTVDEPNLPLSHEVFSGNGGAQLDLYVGGRQFSSWGINDKVERTVGAYRLDISGIGTTFRPLISFKIKSGFEQIPIRLAGVSILSSANLVFEIQRNATLTNANFTAPGNHDSSEIATQWDISADATPFTSGNTIFEGLAPGGTGVSSAIQSDALPNRPISEFDTYTLAVRRVTGTNATVTANLRITEDW